MNRKELTAVGLILVLFLGEMPLAPAGQDTPAPQIDEALTGQWLVLERVGRYGRAPVHTDALEAEIVAGRWKPPQAGDQVRVSEDTVRTWEAATPGDHGWVHHKALDGGYACLTITMDRQRVMLLEPAGHSMVYVNGEPRAGDPYSTNWIRLPVRLRAGTNTFLFLVGRGRVRARLTAPKGDVLFSPRDKTLPDLIRGEKGPFWGALPVLNATGESLENLVIEAVFEGATLLRTTLPLIPPMSARKVAFRVAGPSAEQTDDVEVTLRLLSGAGGEEELLDTVQFELGVRGPRDRHKRTFVSDIDGSVQYYAVTPAHPETDEDVPLALFLTLHGAGVQAAGLAGHYKHKSWGHVVAPTNRRPFGFDWEDWGRLDTLEVLDIVQQRWKIDPQRIYLTGHSMGGHGVWHLGAVYPDLFAAIGPSAAWPEFWSYGGAASYDDPTPIEQILVRAVSPSRTLALSRNYVHYGVYVLHGERDDNVPVVLGRKMRSHLAEFHADFAYYERPGAEHWWGRACVDWPPMFDFFKHHTRPAAEAVHHIEFHTASPGISASSHWVTIDAQTRPLAPSSVDIKFDPKTNKFSGTTENVARLALDLTALGPSRKRVELDEQTLEDIPWPDEPRIWLSREGQTWRVAEPPSADLKRPERYGPFKEVFKNRFMFVYGTQGTEEENAGAYRKARHDAETFWYRGNGAVDVLPDAAFDPQEHAGRNVILYGNADTNGTWQALLGQSPVQVRRGVVVVGEREIAGDDLACLFIRPRAESDRALVGAVSGTGVAGLRLTERLPYFVSGVAYPDCIVLGPEVLTQGTAGIRTAGFFGLDWSVDGGEFAWWE